MNNVVIGILGGLLRAAQALIEASPTIVCGLLVVGVLRNMVGAEGTRRLFGAGPSEGTGRWTSLLRAWGLGMLLPVCSFGVLPVGREMRRMGVPAGTVLSFVLAAPLLNPLSLLYGLTLSDPLVIICFGLGSLILSTVVGSIWQRMVRVTEQQESILSEPQPPAGLKRMAAVGLTAADTLTGPFLWFLLVGLLGVALLGSVLPFGVLQSTMSHRNVVSPLLMTGVGIPLFAAPMKVMMMMGLMFEHGNSIGAAFALFVMGAGTTFGLLAWITRMYGTRQMLVWLSITVAVVLGLAYSMEQPLYFSEAEIGHTHTFDDISAPTSYSSTYHSFFGLAERKITDSLGPMETAGVLGLALFFVVGLVGRVADRQGRLTQWLLEEPKTSDRPVAVWNRPLPAPVLGGAALLGLLVFATLGAYIYYPSPQTVLDEIGQTRANALVAARTGNVEETKRHLRRWNDLTRRLEVGVYIRGGGLDSEARLLSQSVRDHLEALVDFLDHTTDPSHEHEEHHHHEDDHDHHHHEQTVDNIIRQVNTAHEKCREHYLGLAK